MQSQHSVLSYVIPVLIVAVVFGLRAWRSGHVRQEDGRRRAGA